MVVEKGGKYTLASLFGKNRKAHNLADKARDLVENQK